MHVLLCSSHPHTLTPSQELDERLHTLEVSARVFFILVNLVKVTCVCVCVCVCSYALVVGCSHFARVPCSPLV